MSNRFLNLKSIEIIGQIDKTFYATAFEYAQAQIHTMAIMESKKKKKIPNTFSIAIDQNVSQIIYIRIKTNNMCVWSVHNFDFHELYPL